MAKRKNKAAKNAAPERSNRKALEAIAIQATYEIEALANALSYKGLDQHGGDTFVYLARGIARRIDTLNGILMSTVRGHDIVSGKEFGEDDIARFERELYGVGNV